MMNFNFKKTNKKGSWFVDNLGQMVLVAIGIGVGIYLIWAYVLHGGGDSINSLQQCGALTGNKGQCKESCDTSLELELPNVGCKGITNKCCVAKDEGITDTVLPSGYGGTGALDFKVDSIIISGTTAPTGCEFDSKNSDGTINYKSMICTPGNKIRIPVEIAVSNTGTGKDPMTVFADPAIIINDNGDSLRGPGIYTGKSSVIISSDASKNTGKITTNVDISVVDSKEGYYWKIYPYAKCTTTECKKTDTRSRGVLNLNRNDFIMVKFIGK